MIDVQKVCFFLLFSGLLEGYGVYGLRLFVGLEILEEIPQNFMCVFLKFKVSNWGFKDEVNKQTNTHTRIAITTFLSIEVFNQRLCSFNFVILFYFTNILKQFGHGGKEKKKEKKSFV